EKFGIPRQPNLVNIESYIEMVEPYNDLLAFEGIEQFSHLWLIWQFHDNK
ncbi:tRNA (N6-threonylcarbamoyladenosine(37)-N6)-methyltransferase TrmO, partial [Acinetobacter baumannii]|nr:tRNA (N6-threonylcarbamoyladenosine(37)-N6)-methyltransferase TrmO [Acinetobacter baumannii]